jgi:hypothetical protein
MRDKQLASLGDAYVNLVYSLALTSIKGYPQGTKVSDQVLAEALKMAGLREHLGTRVAKKDMANASEAILAEAYRRNLLTIDESVRLIIKQGEIPAAGLSDLLKSAAQKLQSSGRADST